MFKDVKQKELEMVNGGLSFEASSMTASSVWTLPQEVHTVKQLELNGTR